MIELTIANRKDTSSKMLSIGKQGENKAEQIAVDFSLWKDELGSGIITAMMKRHGDTAAYPVVLTVAGNIATWDITSTDTAKDGRGEIEFKYTVSDTVVRSETFPVFVYPSVSATTTTPPDPYDNWVETLTELGEEVEGYAEEAAESAEEAADSAEEAADAAVSAEIAQLAAEVASTHYPKIDETTKHWLVWNPATSAYTDTGVVAEGSDAEVTSENITAALGYTPADEDDIPDISGKADKSTIVTTGTTIECADNTEYHLTDVTTLTITYPQNDFACYFRITTASSGTITIELPTSQYVGSAPSFGNGETWLMYIENGIVVAGKAASA